MRGHPSEPTRLRFPFLTRTTSASWRMPGREAADFLVVGHHDSLAVGELSPLRILSPRAFLTLARGDTLEQGREPGGVNLS